MAWFDLSPTVRTCTVRACTCAGLKLLHVKIRESTSVVRLAYQRKNHRLGHGNFHFLHFSAEAVCHKSSAASDLDCLAQISADFPFSFIFTPLLVLVFASLPSVRSVPQRPFLWRSDGPVLLTWPDVLGQTLPEHV